MAEYKTILIDPKTISSQDFELYFLNSNHQDKSSYFYYHAYKLAVRYFRNRIFAQDKDLQYSTIAKRHVIDKDCYKEHMSVYGPSYEKLENYWKRYKQDHKDEFDTFERIYVVKDNNHNPLKLSYTPTDCQCSLEDAIEGYFIAKQKLEKCTSTIHGYCSLPCETYCTSRPRYSYRHHLLREALKEKLGIPNSSSYLKIEDVPQMKRISTFFVPEDNNSFDAYITSFSKFMLNQ